MGLEILRFITHYGMHLLVPGIIAYVFFQDKWLKIWILLTLSMLIDLDHLLATPVFDAQRCSIGFHPLHSLIALLFYIAGLFIRETRIIAFGLVFHLITDAVDCLWI